MLTHLGVKVHNLLQQSVFFFFIIARQFQLYTASRVEYDFEGFEEGTSYSVIILKCTCACVVLLFFLLLTFID